VQLTEPKGTMNKLLILLPLALTWTVALLPQRFYDRAAIETIHVLARYLAKRGLVKMEVKEKP
jgi:hypothetical protein